MEGGTTHMGGGSPPPQLTIRPMTNTTANKSKFPVTKKVQKGREAKIMNKQKRYLLHRPNNTRHIDGSLAN